MDYLTIIKNVLAVIETGALIGALVLSSRAIKEKKDAAVRKSRLIQGGIYFVVYVVLNVIRHVYFQ